MAHFQRWLVAGVCAGLVLAGWGSRVPGPLAGGLGRIPAGVHAVAVTPVFGLNRNTRLDRLDRAFTVTAPGRVARIVALADGLPLFPPGLFSCPSGFGGQMRLAFLTRPGGPVLALLTADFGGCQGVSVRIGGRNQAALGGPGSPVPPFPDEILAIAGVSWPH